MMHHPELLVLISTIALSLYYTLLKKFPDHMMILYFWLHALSYAAFTGIFFFKEKLLIFDTTALEQLAFDTSYNNLPLYALSAACLLGTYIILDKLIKRYPVSQVLALAEIELIFSTIGYLLLGDKVTFISSLGIAVIFIGGIISGFEYFSFKNPLQSFRNYDKNLLKWSTIKAVFYSSTLIITYLCTAHYSETVKHILYALTKHMHFIPFVAISPIHFNIGVQFANFIFMFLFIKYYLKETSNIIRIMKQQKSIILQLSVLYIIHAYFYYEAFDLIENKNFITAISKLYLPATLFLCHIVYQEKISKPQFIGMGIIILGTFISIWG